MVTHSRAPDRLDSLRFLNQPQPVQVRAGIRGELAAVRLRGRWRTVEEVRDTWRIDDEWWRKKPISRMYYEVRLEGRATAVLFHDLAGQGWYAQRV